MKRTLLFQPVRYFIACSLVGLMIPVFLGLNNMHAQVNFIQTTDADFNKGVLNNVVVGSNNVSLQTVASDVGTWLTTTVLPQTLSGHRAVSWNDKYVYVVGGYNNLTYSNAVYVANIQSGGISTWTTLNALPVGLKDAAVVIGTNTIYVMGGRNDTEIFNTIYYASINTNGTIGTWQTSSVTLPATLWGHTAVYLNGYIYVAGGSNVMTENSAISNVYYTKVKADNSLTSFSAGTALLAARNKHSMVTYNSKLYVLGGINSVGSKMNTVFYATPGLDGTTGSWSSGTAMPSVLAGHSTVVTNGLITVMAGENATTLSNTVYFASIDAALPWSWVTSPYVMYDYTKDGAAFQGNGIIYYCGGTNLSGTPIFNCRYANLTLVGGTYVNHGVFVSNPFYELGAERLINTLTWNATYDPSFANCEVSYRTATSTGVWGNWTALTSTSPITVNETKQYLQYRVVFTGQTTYNATFHDMTLTTPGTQLTGSLNAITTFTKALSPYWATSDISFTAGTHTFEAGATILFLPETGLTVSQANIICNGTAVDSVKFMYFTNESGKWDGIYFDPNSDNGVSSQFYYTVISGAGYGSNAANLYCNQSNEPLLVRCNIRGAGGHGIRLNSAQVNIQNSMIRRNTGNGMYLENSNPVLIGTSISYNGAAGVYFTSNTSMPNFNTTTINNNLYGFHYPSPNYTIYQPNGSPTLTANTYNGIAISGGDVTSSNKVWNSVSYDYFLLGTVRIVQYGSQVRLTIEPGNTIKVVSGAQIQIGANSYGGELYALGTADSMITFTSYNGLPGGWNGIYFHENSDNYGGQSNLTYCIIEKGNDYNYYSESTSQPNVISHSIIRNAVTDGARYWSSYGSILNCQFLNNGRYPLYFLNTTSDPVHTGNSYTGNGINRIALSGGTYSINRTITNDGIPYYVLENILISGYSAHPRLTIEPGITLEFAAGKNIQIGSSNNGGDLYAQGTSGSPIVFKAFNDSPGGWSGIYFHPQSDAYGSTSVFEYCSISQGLDYNIYCEGTSMPSMNHCIINNSASHGMIEYQSSPSIQNSQFLNNNGYPLKYNDWSCNSYLNGNTYSGNLFQYIALSAGSYSSDRTIYNDGIQYHVLDNVYIGSYNGHPRITVQPGVTLNFAAAKGIQVGGSSDGGDLYAQGTSGSPIVLKAYNDTPGGWAGIFFHPQSDAYSSTSVLEYCTITQGASHNIYCENTTQPTISNCIVSNSAAHGLIEYQSSPSIQNSQFLNNNGYPLKYNDWSCNSYLNGNTYSGNLLQYIALSGGSYSSNRILYSDGIPYHVLDNIYIGAYNNHPRITVQPGVTLNFAPAKGIQVGGSNDGGDLYAQGTSVSPIIFKAYNDTPGGWSGIYFHPQSDAYSSTSFLEYCTIMQGSGYNICCESTVQPTINKSFITKAAGLGIYLMGSANLTIRNTSIVYNGSYGVQFDGTSTATIGNTAAYTCNLYNNGVYQIYNNSTANVNARYNYWASGDSTMISFEIYDKTDNASKGYVYYGNFAQVPAAPTSTMIMSGVVKYANTGGSVMKSAAMVIKDFSGSTIGSTTTNVSGLYTFPELPSGNYKMTITPAQAWGGVNSTDALLVLNHFAQISSLNGIKLAAADVNYSHTINATDALYIMNRYAGVISSFPVGDFLYDSDTVFSNDNLITNNIDMLCFGDVNASYAPGVKDGSMISLAYDGVVSVPSFTDFNLPVIVREELNLGAVSLGFQYPDEYLEVTGVELSNGSSEFVFHADKGLCRIAWCSLNPLILKDGDILLTLKVRSKDLAGMTTPIAFELYEYCELADGEAFVISGTELAIPLVKTIPIGIGEQCADMQLSVFPNPAQTSARVGFSLPSAGNVKLTVSNVYGHTVKSLAAGHYPAGTHTLNWVVTDLPAGMYFIRIENTGNGQTSHSTVRVVISR